MHLEKLVTTLQAFNGFDLARLRKYVNAPYFKMPRCSVILLNYLYPLHPKFSERKVNEEAIAQLDENLSTAAKQSWAATKILGAIDNMLAYEQWQQNPQEVLRYTLSGLKEKHLFAEFKRQYVAAQAALDRPEGHDFETLFQRHLLTEASLNGFDAKLKRSCQNDLEPVLKTLDEFYALKKLRYMVELMERQRIFGSSYKQETVFPLLDILKPYTNESHPYVYLFVHVFLMLNADTYEDSKGPYEVIKQYAETHSEGGLSKSLVEAMGLCINFTLKWYNKGHEEAGDEYLWWIDLRMKKNRLLENEKMLPVTFRNIVSIATISKNNPDWMKRFIERYAPLLPDTHREASQSFANGLYAYKRGRYKEAIRYFMVAQAGEEAIFNCMIRRWQFMALYNCDNQETETLLNHLSSFEKFLIRHAKPVANIKQIYEKFIHYCQQLVKVAPHEIGEPLLLTLQAEEHFPGKPWLVRQFEAKLPTARAKRHQVNSR